MISIEIKGKDNYHEIMNELILSDNYNKEGIDEAFKKKYKATLEKPIYNFSDGTSIQAEGSFLRTILIDSESDSPSISI